ncbi:MAG: hypothetical protein LBQ22_12485 [Bacteroidales bacterium]|jgi:uncharacterized protein involved in exopolysaccharide biosynthesis|nr:hypothetical protein [Bacteroidales bacterium]
MENNFKTTDLLTMVLKWKWHLLALALIAGMLGAVFSSPFFIKPKYKSYSILYPANIKAISDESESEQMLEIIQSSDIKFKVIEELDLYSHYKIDEEKDKEAVFNILSEFDKNVSVQKTSNEGIKITALDENPQMAVDIINSMIKYYDELVLKLNVTKSEEILEIYKKEKDLKIEEIDSLSNSITDLRMKYGLLDLTSQVKTYTEAINNGKNINEAKTVLGNWKEYGTELAKTDSLFSYALRNYYTINTIYENTVRDVNKFQTYCHVISKPFPADKKSYPVRWIIVLFSALGTLLFGLITVAIIEGSKNSKN